MGNTKSFAATIVIVNLNGSQHLTSLFACLAQQSVQDYEVVVVDNGSVDNSLDLVEQARRQYELTVRILRNDANRGFAPACNQGIRIARSDWLIMLNNDTYPEPNWLEQLLLATEEPERPGMVASKLLRAHHPDQIDSAGIAMDMAGIAWDWRGGDQDDEKETGLVEVFGPCGGAALYARALLDELGGFDEDFFAYLEDVDLACRARLAGWTCFFQPQARVLHVHSATLGDHSPRKRFLLARNKVWMIVKNFPNPWFTLFAPSILAYDAMAVGYGIVQRRDIASLRGRLAGLATAKRAWTKRRHIQQSYRDRENWRRMIHPLVVPWNVSKRYAHLQST